MKVGEMIGIMFKVLGATVMVTGMNMKKVTSFIIMKTKMEVAIGKMVWMEKNVGIMMMMMLMRGNVLKEETIHIVKVMAGPIMKTIMVGLILIGEIIGIGINGKMIALIVNIRKNGEMITIIRLIMFMIVMIMNNGQIRMKVGETIGGIVPVLGATVKVTGMFMKIIKEMTNGNIGKTKMEVATGKMV